MCLISIINRKLTMGEVYLSIVPNAPNKRIESGVTTFSIAIIGHQSGSVQFQPATKEQILFKKKQHLDGNARNMLMVHHQHVCVVPDEITSLAQLIDLIHTPGIHATFMTI